VPAGSASAPLAACLPSTICKVLQGGELPRRFEVIDAIVWACGGMDEDRARFVTAWRRLVLPDPKIRSVLHGGRPAPA
jgi:hypothetical protein